MTELEYLEKVRQLLLPAAATQLSAPNNVGVATPTHAPVASLSA